MKTTEYVTEILNELHRSAACISNEEADQLADHILSSNQIFTAGAGRSGLMAKSFAMRLMHMGFNAHIAGEVLTPPLRKGDLVIIGSGSGETKSLINTAAKAKSLHGIVATLTINPDSSIGKQSDLIVKMPGSPKDQSNGSYKTMQPMGSLFEQTLLLFYDAIILKLMEKKGLDSETMFTYHANLE
ncbi:6-phospho-3-hexuloisomerase [Bacillus halotolerans]|uniref:6-phospho-3-hexuloisomerase n=1 Tax=Bacillus TaxID=1386 RepID=UPI000D018132|nr:MULTISPECIES: 6-phospho-3-hexuloisomerase [Bacillus]MCK8099174.1 6-phospho-3-hexuloisomerase [Bacillus sp. 2CMS4F]MEC1607133.1 6-phospho-3-hexuloisomerase [Bacillus halotolerans]PRP49417.1 6-phospho-3-hexuloisomerase [Bacillus halotolerans]PRP57574.1 6-phospho-3-hexuloisomerase [Bacillus halotolerans]PRP63093.1 6-phospho-3-hexuloisomerase [Bacillus halotolerans]